VETKEQIKALLAIVKHSIDAIKETGAAGMPCGMLYSALMSQGCTISQYEQLERLICNSGVVRKSSNVLYYNL
jgi:hypothetical protein